MMSQSIPVIVAQLDAIAQELEKVSHIVSVMSDLIVTATEEKKCCGKCGDASESVKEQSIAAMSDLDRERLRDLIVRKEKELTTPTDEPPMLGIGPDQLGEPIAIGDMVRCAHCAELHEIRGGKNESGEESDLLLYYRCPQTDCSYLAGIDGQRLQG